MRTNTSRLSSFFLAVFFAFSCLHLSASIPEEEQVAPLIQATTSIKEGILYLSLKAPSHLALNEQYFLFSKEGGRGLEGDFIFTELHSGNPRMISFSIFAKNTDQGVDCRIDEVQIFEEEGWFSSTYSKKGASQVLHVQNKTINMAEPPEMELHIVTEKNVSTTSTVVLFKLMN